jgi:signal transduction histidine kinase
VSLSVLSSLASCHLILLCASRTPLNTVILGLHLLEEHLETLRSLSQHQEEGVNVVTACSELIQELHDNTTVAVNTLNDLINYDKIESKTFSIEKKPVKIWSVIKKTVGLLSLQANEKRVEIKMEFERNSSKPHNNSLSQLRVSGDSIKLGQVVRNIVSNALKFTPSNGEIVISGIVSRPPSFVSLFNSEI